MLSIAARINPGDNLLALKIRLRNRMLRRLSGRDDHSLIKDRPGFSTLSSNAWFGEEIVFEMQGLLDRNATINTLQEHFAKFECRGSTQERQALLSGLDIIARAVRYQGQFEEAERRYVEIMQDFPKDARPARFMASYLEVLCERGSWQRAMDMLELEFDSRSKLPGRRLEIVRGHIHLASALWEFYRSGSLSQHSLGSLQSAKSIYQHHRTNLQRIAGKSKTSKANHFLACAGFAMAEHVLGFHYWKSQEPIWEEFVWSAFDSWQEAQIVAVNSWKESGYSETITLYSQSVLLYLLKNPEADSLRAVAQRKFRITGRQFWCVAQGTVWFQILERFETSQGQTPFSKITLTSTFKHIETTRCMLAKINSQPVNNI